MVAIYQKNYIRKIHIMKSHDNIYINVKRILSPSEFFACIGKISEFTDFQNFECKLNEWCHENFITTNASDKNIIQSNQFILINNNSINQVTSWKRALILDQYDMDFSKILLIDEGLIINYPSEKIFTKLPDFYKEFEAQAKICLLKNAIPNSESNMWSKDAIDYFKKIINKDGLIVSSIQEIESLNPIFKIKFELEVLDKDHYLLDLLISKGYAKKNSIGIINERNFLKKINNNQISQNKKEDFVLYQSIEDEINCERINGSIKSNFSSFEFYNMSRDFESLHQVKNNLEEIILSDDDDDDSSFTLVYRKSSNENSQKNSLKNVIEKTMLKKFKEEKTFFENDKNQNDSWNESARSQNEYEYIFEEETKNLEANSKKQIESLNNLEKNKQIDYSQITIQSNLNNSSNLISNENIRKNNSKTKKIFNYIDLETEPSFNVYFQDVGEQNKPPLNYQNYICSDDTISTGYITNSNMNPLELSRQIKSANLSRFNPQKNIHDHNFTPIIILDATQNEENIYEIVSGTNGFFDNMIKKKLALMHIYKESPEKNSKLIIRCILEEIKQENIDEIEGLHLLNNLEFCSEELFMNVINELLKNIDALNNDSLFLQLADSTSRNFCKLLALLYRNCCCFDKFKFSSAITNFCDELITEWITIHKNKEVSNSTYIANLKKMHHFLEFSFDQIKKTDKLRFKAIYENAKAYVLDNTLDNKIKIQAFNIVDLYGQDCIKKCKITENNENKILKKSSIKSNLRTNEKSIFDFDASSDDETQKKQKVI